MYSRGTREDGRELPEQPFCGRSIECSHAWENVGMGTRWERKHDLHNVCIHFGALCLLVLCLPLVRLSLACRLLVSLVVLCLLRLPAKVPDDTASSRSHVSCGQGTQKKGV